jgi:ABC-2 type transport system permease protein
MKKINTAFVIIMLIAVLVIVNILADKLPWKYDMTVEKIFSLSGQTKNVIQNLKKTVNIIAFYQDGKEDATVKALLEEYKKLGKDKLNIEYVDAEKNPVTAKRYDTKNEGLFNDSIVFESEGNIKKLTSSDIYSLNNAYGKSFSGEQQFTGALIYVTSPELSRIYFLEGHQETNLDSDLLKLKDTVESEANVASSLNLLKVKAIPEDADVIVAVSPKRDLSAGEKLKLQDYLAKGGKAIFLFDVLTVDTNLTNFIELMKIYGLDVRNNFVVEENRDGFYSDNKMYISPYYTDQSIVGDLASESLAVIFPYSLNLGIINNGDKNLTIEPVLQTSDKSWIRYDIMDPSPTRTGRDIAGPANVAVAVTRDNSDDRNGETRLVAAGNAKFVENSMLDIQGNIDLFMNMVNWTENKTDSLSLRPKMMNSNQMIVTGAGYIIMMAVSIVIIPFAAFGAGLLVWLRRRNS